MRARSRRRAASARAACGDGAATTVAFIDAMISNQQSRQETQPGGEARRSIGREARSEEAVQGVQKSVQAVVVHPVPCALEADHARVGEMPEAAVLLGIGSPALLAVDEQ